MLVSEYAAAPEGAIFLEEGESLYAAPGKMQAAKNVSMATEYTAGIFESMKRFFVGGPDYFNNKFEANRGGGWVLLQESVPGQMASMEITAGHGMKIRTDRWAASTSNVDLETVYEGTSGIVRGTGVAMLQASVKANNQRGKIFFCADEGVVKKIEVSSIGGPVMVDNDSIIGYSDRLTCSFRTSGNGLQSLMFGKEGIVCDFYGEGTVYIASTPQDTRINPCSGSEKP